MKRYAIIILCALAVSACATPPAETVKDDAGPYPENYRELIDWYLEETLPRPESTKKFEIIKAPEKIRTETYYGFMPLYEGQQVWEVFVAFDTKNARGRHIGKDMHVVWIRHGKIVAYDYARPPNEFVVKQRLR
ncbi:MAG: hypothetical protein KGY56_14680 [Desulfobacterales bacterium]|nr:hypothetical protein [Desulfobacterales bacterium]